MGGGQAGQGGNSSPGTLGCSDKGYRPELSHGRAGKLGVYPQLPICPWLMGALGDLVLWHFCPAPKGSALAAIWESFVLRDLGPGLQDRQKRGACPGSLSHSQGSKGYRIDFR